MQFVTCPYCRKGFYIKTIKEEEPFSPKPSDLNIEVFVMAPPFHVDFNIANNVWMKELPKEERKIDKEKFMSQWMDLYQVVSADSMILLMPSKPGLQDITFVNSFVSLYLPSKQDYIIVISKFRAEGRDAESEVAKEFLQSFGYHTIRPETYLEGYPELKLVTIDNDKAIYWGNYGVRTQPETHDWLMKQFDDIYIIKSEVTDEYLYHGDCTFFMLDNENAMICTKVVKRKPIRELEKYVNIYPVDKDCAYMGICNSLKLGTSLVINASNLHRMSKKDKYYDLEVKKNETLEKICNELGIEVMYLDLSEAMKLGALLSCFITPLNYPNLILLPPDLIKKG